MSGIKSGMKTMKLLVVLFTSVALLPLRVNSNELQTQLTLQPIKPMLQAKPKELKVYTPDEYYMKEEGVLGEYRNEDGVCIFVKKTTIPNPGHRGTLDPCDTKNYTVDVFVMEPYRSLMLTFIKEEFKQMRAGSNCTNTKLDSFRESNISELKMKSSSTFTFPFLAYKESNIAHRHFFLPMLDPPGAFYIARRNTISISTLIKNCVQLWPLLVIAIFMSLVSGFVIWILETQSNTEEFPAPFFRGWFEGIWWSFITMTTVGYGDRTPKTIGGRLFSIVWITVGIVVFCILAGELTTVILDAKEGEEHSMINKKVGTLDRLYEKSLVALYGGYLRPMNRTKDGDEDQQMLTLAKKLQQGSLDGILIDKFTYRYIEGRSGNSTNPAIRYFLYDTIMTNIPQKSRKVSYGFLFPEAYKGSKGIRPSQKSLYDEFKRMFEDKTMIYQMNATRSFQTTLKSAEEDDKNHFYMDTVVSNMVMICASLASMLVFGILYEVRRKRAERSNRQ